MCASSLSANNGLGKSKASHTMHKFPGKINAAGFGLQRRATSGFTTGQIPFLGHGGSQGHVHTHKGGIGDPSTAFQPCPGAVLREGAAGRGWGMSLSRHHQSWLSAAAGASITARAPRASSWARAGCQTMSSELSLLQTQR